MQQKLTKSDRILLIACLQIQGAQRRIFENPKASTGDIPETDTIDKAVEILREGYEHFYGDALSCFGGELSEEGEFTMAESSKIFDVLDMYRGIENYMNANPEDDEVNKHLAARFRGFDGNHELRQMQFVDFAVNRMGRYSELKPKGKESEDFNSHIPMMDEYERMVGVWQKAKNRVKLTKKEVLAILEAA